MMTHLDPPRALGAAGLAQLKLASISTPCPNLGQAASIGLFCSELGNNGYHVFLFFIITFFCFRIGMLASIAGR